ncbi:MAG: hypothetical protein ACKOPO_06850 [Novosphingobium sp.]
MFGDPQPITQKQRSAAYVVMWLGALGSLVLLVSHIAGWQIGKIGPVMGITAGGMLSVAWNYRSDDYFRSLCAKGQQFLTFFMGAYLFIMWCDITLHDDGKADGALTAWMADGYMAAICASAAFYAGYAWAYIRDRF